MLSCITVCLNDPIGTSTRGGEDNSPELGVGMELQSQRTQQGCPPLGSQASLPSAAGFLLGNDGLVTDLLPAVTPWRYIRF